MYSQIISNIMAHNQAFWMRILPTALLWQVWGFDDSSKMLQSLSLPIVPISKCLASNILSNFRWWWCRLNEFNLSGYAFVNLMRLLSFMEIAGSDEAVSAWSIISCLVYVCTRSWWMVWWILKWALGGFSKVDDATQLVSSSSSPNRVSTHEMPAFI